MRIIVFCGLYWVPPISGNYLLVQSSESQRGVSKTFGQCFHMQYKQVNLLSASEGQNSATSLLSPQELHF